MKVFRQVWQYLVLGILFGAGVVFLLTPLPDMDQNNDLFNTNFGFWLAAQHAVVSDDFGRAAEFLGQIDGDVPEIVSAARGLLLFLDSGDTSEIRAIKGLDRAIFNVINVAVLAKDSKWREANREFRSEGSQFWAPLRIWSMVGSNNRRGAIQFIDDMPRATSAWKDFQKGAVNAATRNPRTARRFFQAVPVSFMNLSDYHLVISFYDRFEFREELKELQALWNQNPGGVYMAEVDFAPDWSKYDTYQKMIAAGLIQKVSHSGGVAMGETGLLALRIAQMLGADEAAIKYYIGMYFYSNNSDNYKRYWEPLLDNPIYGPFVRMRMAERLESRSEVTRALVKILRDHPLFLPALQSLWRREMAAGRDHEIMRALNRGIAQANEHDLVMAYLLRARAHTHYMMGDLNLANDDLEKAADLAPLDGSIMAMRVRVWAAKGENLNEAYRFAISLVRAFPSNIENWGLLAMVVRELEGEKQALELLERVAPVAEDSSELFMILGDLRVAAGNGVRAREAYQRALSLADDGLVIRRDIERKMRRLPRN